MIRLTLIAEKWKLKTVFLLLFAFFSALPCLAEPPYNKAWTKQMGTASYDGAFGIAVDGTGNAYVAGTTSGGLDANTNAGSSDLLLIKLDINGNMLWTRQMGTPVVDQATSVAVDNNGNVYVAGYTYGGLDGNANAGGADLFLIKYDSNGNKLWTKEMGTTSDDMSNAVALDSDGDAYVAGRTNGGLDGNTNTGGADYFVVKFDGNGNKLWTRQTGSYLNDVANGITVDGNGNAYVVGYMYDGVNYNSDLFLAKYDRDGNSLWAKPMGTTLYDMAWAVALDSAGNAYVAGRTGGGLDGNANAGSSDPFLIKFDSTGNKLWTRQMGTAAFDGASGIAVDSSGNAYVAGHTLGWLDGNANAGDYDLFLIKYDSNGNKLWTKEMGTTSTEYVRAMAVNSYGNAYVVGDTYGGLDGNVNAGDSDLFVVKFDGLVKSPE